MPSSRSHASISNTRQFTLGVPTLMCFLAACSLVLVSSSQAHSQQSTGSTPQIALSSISPSTPHVGSSRSLATAYAAGTTLTFAGRIAHAPTNASAAIEESSSHGWKVQAHARLRKGANFKLSWKPSIVGQATVRVALRTVAGHDIAATPSQTMRILSDGCAISQIAQADPNDGLIVGGLYIAGPYLEGGAMNPITGQASLTPQALGCDWQPYTVTVSDGSSTQIQKAGGNDGYVFAALPGAYTLTATYDGQTCTGSGTVTAGQQTEINTFCNLEPVP
jgi:hypothetical protein